MTMPQLLHNQIVANSNTFCIDKDTNSSYRNKIAEFDNELTHIKGVNAKVEDNLYLSVIDQYVKKDYIYKSSTQNGYLKIRLILNGNYFQFNPQSLKFEEFNSNHLIIDYNHRGMSLKLKRGTRLRYICLSISENYLQDNEYINDILKTYNYKKETLNIFCPELQEKYSKPSEEIYKEQNNRIFTKHFTMDLLLFILDKIKNYKKEDFVISSDDINRLKQVKSFIDNNYEQKLTIALLSRKILLNESKLKKGFKQLFNSTIHEYLKNVRLNKAMELLQTKKYNVNEVGRKVGYTNPSSFSYAFSKRYLCSPKVVIQKASKAK